MTEKDSKRNLSLKGRKFIKPKQRGSSASSNTVTIQVKRKKLLSKKGDIGATLPTTNNKVETDQTKHLSQEQDLTAQSTKQEYGLKQEKTDYTKNKKKAKPDKDTKIKNFKEI